jgi:hypothetical protein
MYLSSASSKLGLLLSAIHFFLFIAFAAYLKYGIDDGQLRLLWAIWLPIDFPVSILVTKGLSVTQSELLRFWFPYFVHGLLGTVWWFFIPKIITAVFDQTNRYIKR